MESDHKPEESTETTPPHDALGQPSDTSNIGGPSSDNGAGGEPTKKLSILRKLSRRVNLYYLSFAVVVIIGGVVTGIGYLNSKKAPPTPSIANENLTTAQLKQLADSNATVGGSGETLTVQGNTVLSGNVLARGDLAVAGTLQLGGDLKVPQLDVSNNANLASAQISTEQVSNGAIFQGPVTFESGLTAPTGSSVSLGGLVTVSQITVTSKLLMSGNGELDIPNHINFSGTTAPHISSQGALGGGTASVSGSDTSGTITVKTGGSPQASNPAANDCLAKVTFNQSFSGITPNVIISLVDPNSTLYSSQNYVYGYAGDVTASSFDICTYNTPAANQQHAFSYLVTGL